MNLGPLDIIPFSEFSIDEEKLYRNLFFFSWTAY